MTENSVEILLVEDNPNDVELTLHAFQKSKLVNRVHVARDGVEALTFLFGNEAGNAQNHPKVILLDLKLPKVDGLEVLRRLKANANTQSIPVVVLTSSREERDVVDSYQLGVNSYIVKPVEFDQFVDATRQIGLYWVLLNHRPLL